MFHLRRRTSVLAMAAVFSLAALSVPAVGVNAQPRDGGPGDAAVCYYNGQAYSEGAQITLPDGTVQTCQSDGTWSTFEAPGSYRIRFAPPGHWLAPLP